VTVCHYKRRLTWCLVL